jgi:DNA-binding transcriptional regulator YdaS (Cro superfamily)
MIKLLLLSAVLTVSGPTQAQTPSRAELKKPLSEAVEKVLAEFVQSCVPEKKKQLTAHMEEAVKTLDTTVKLTPEEKLALQAAAKTAVEASVKEWQPLAVMMMRTYLNRSSDAAAIRHIGMWKPEVAGPNEPVEDWTPPQETASWITALKATLGEARYATWHEVDDKARKQADKEIESHLERWVRESRGPMNEDLRAKIDLMKKKLTLSEAQVASLNKAADSLLDQISNAEKKRATGMLRTLPSEARENIMGRSYFYIRFDRPRGEVWDKAWDEAAAKVLPAELAAQWQKTDKEERSKAETEAADMIKPSEQQAQQQMEIAMGTEIDGMVMALNLNKERQQALEKLSKEAIQESLKLARKGWLLQAKNYSSAERKRIRGNVYFGINDEQQAIKQPTWTEGIKKLLSEEERTRMATDTKDREQRSSLAISRACLAEMDKMLAMNQDQRTKLEPLLVDMMLPLMEQRRQQYWSYNATQLFQNAGKLKEEKVRAILDDIQWKHWRELINTNGNSSRNSMPDMNGTFPEVPDMELAISQHLYKMYVTERSKTLATMMPQVEEATRLLSLPEPAVEKLTTAAKGAVETSLDNWRQFTESFVRQSVMTATPKNVLQALAGTERASLSRNDIQPQNTDLWKTALKTTLNDSQLKTLDKVAGERTSYRLKAMASMSVSELDRRRKLSADQCTKIEAAVQKVLTEYLPDIERYMSLQWFLQYYYALVPVAGVAEKDMQAILTPEQWKLCKDRDLPDALQYWEGIKNNHEQRMKRGAQANGNQLIINGGIIFDQ